MRTSRRSIFTGWALALLLAAGCGKEAQKQGDGEGQPRLAPGVYVHTTKVQRVIAEMSDGDVIVRVNGRDLAKRDFTALNDLQGALYRLRERKTPDEAKVRKFMRYQQPELVMRMVQEEIFRQAAERLGLSPDEKRLKARQRAFLGQQHARGVSFADYLQKLGPARAALLERMIREELLTEEVCLRLTTNDFRVVTEAQIDAHVKRIEKFDARSKRKNAAALKKAQDFRARVLAGADFAEDGRKSAELRPEYAAAWETVQLGELEAGSPLSVWLSNARTGDVSEPIDLDDGLAVIKVLSRAPAEVPPGADPVDDFKLARCTFYAYEYAVPQTRAQIRDMLRDEQRSAAYRDVGVRLAREAVVEFPNGTNFFRDKPKKKKGKKKK